MAHYKRNRAKTKPAYNDENDVVDSVGYLDTVPFKQFSADVERAIKASSDPMSDPLQSSRTGYKWRF